ncbi:flavin reductase family protein [Roseospira navarrensis]|uniref:Flavin reductase n=1 Tax=Roseospira navarrensis TaxID=140058 RepID=A0A7X1ZB63_9PROT|nr:flavin reductase family protein [Roseospira navarrensis]MQX35293.1 flavin reductase [Roseospira navarrensis]
MTVDSVSFRKALGSFASGVTVVTALDDTGQPVGLTVSAFCSVSLDPPMILICLDKRVSNRETFRRGPFAVNVLSHRQQAVSNRFAEKRDDRFAGIAHTPGRNGAPVLDGCLAVIECTPEHIADGGDHDIIVATVTRVDRTEDGAPLIYYRGGYAALG